MKHRRIALTPGQLHILQHVHKVGFWHEGRTVHEQRETLRRLETKGLVDRIRASSLGHAWCTTLLGDDWLRVCGMKIEAEPWENRKQ